ncbi:MULTISPECIES: glutamate 5-kinase [unclassified Undibacterium]|uniref:glutamate 5-kinase n=1 Tax=unclassified Undibacterium TaxID=2630295 RepID=UPI002AC8F46B|nr:MULTISPECIES: glutamate 5-kinase [unclassified Undibacterium]MEB0141135.1 glutamate 5-kinase [Undibacterium sp. CCC2.1]MEB0174168.1 glutamate 5-kinase [Undibacterium sp. CCC1.1]MEB0178110.1 glutamate 5-kinase [Undibacterium sp. CCC3.4]MEB0217324.1 glutamate 5-kinase [Undibacterium sp. 5I2]WPX45326.1 glutamate 5-kinase [Undibacterium sp. CCC3.4]
MHSVIQQAKRLVIKVGSSLVTNDGRGLDQAAIAKWAAQIATLRVMGKEVVLVSSGAIAEGRQRLGFEQRPSAIHELQACAAVGQMGLAQIYESSFRAHQIGTAQILLTHADLADRERYLNARATLRTLLGFGIVPIINENDTVVTDEIKFGDNDTLGALVANLLEADALIILTDQRGLYTADPRRHADAEFIHEARAGDVALEAMAGGAGTSFGSGGMLTKILAAKRAASSGAHTVIAWGREDNALVRLASGEAIGTQLLSQMAPRAARKQWMADHLQTTGQLVLDDGAVQKLSEEGKSLLPVGVAEVRGQFSRGAVVTCLDKNERPVARGLSNYSSTDARRIMRKPSGEIAAILGFVEEPELIHRDNLVLL